MNSFREILAEADSKILKELKKIYTTTLKEVKGTDLRVLDTTDPDPEWPGVATVWPTGYNLDNYPSLSFRQSENIYVVEYEDDYVETSKVSVAKKALLKFQKQWTKDN